MAGGGEGVWLVGAVAHPVPPVPSDATCGWVLERMSRSDAPQLACVVADGRPVGLVDRTRYLSTMAQRYCVEIYARRPIAALMDRDFRAFDARSAVDALDLAAFAGESAATGFAVTREGRYAGVALMLDLAKLVARRLRGQNERLVEARQELFRANEAKSDFLASISHELRTPLNAIIGFSEAMHVGLFGRIEQPRYREYVGDIRSSADHLLSLINDLLDFRQAESGHLELVEEPLDVADALGGAVRILANAAMAGGISLTWRTEEGLPLLLADARRLRQILLNLLSNAIKFTPPGGHVAVEAGRGPDRSLWIAVRDDGVGIAPEELPRVLSPFGRAQTSYVKGKEGTGLGLPLARLFAELHDGALRVESAVGVGTAVTVAFPPARSASAPRPAAAVA